MYSTTMDYHHITLEKLQSRPLPLLLVVIVPRLPLTSSPSLNMAVWRNFYVTSIFSVNIITILVVCGQIRLSTTDCPSVCDCKWKNGKESVICFNSNLTQVPLLLDSGTQVVDLTGNAITQLKRDEFSSAGLVNLQKVHLAKGRIKSIDRYAFRYILNLIELDLSYNFLNNIPSHIFDSITELRELRLSGNPIQMITNDAFVHLPQLVRLELSNCKLHIVEPKAFRGLDNTLEWLRVDGNLLTNLQPSIVTILSNLHGLELSGNPWNCSCSLQPLREWMLRHNIPYLIPPVCKWPKRLNGKSWDRLDLDEFACTPRIQAGAIKVHAVEGDNVTIGCQVSGSPEPIVRWLLRNKVIANLSAVSYNNGRKLYMVHFHRNMSNLTILATDIQDSGVYVCSAENKAGQMESNVTLTISRRSFDNSISNHIVLISLLAISVSIVTLSSIAICVYRSKMPSRSLFNRGSGPENSGNGRPQEMNSYAKMEINHKVENKGVMRNNNALSSDGNRIGSLMRVNASGTTTPEKGQDYESRRYGHYKCLPTDDQEDRLVDRHKESDPKSSLSFSSRMLRYDGNTNSGDRTTQLSDSNYTDSNLPMYTSTPWKSPSLAGSIGEDLHIPRRLTNQTYYKDDRGNRTQIPKSISGTFEEKVYATDNNRETVFPDTNLYTNVHQFHFMKKVLLDKKSGSKIYTTQADSESFEYPDILNNCSYSYSTLQLPKKTRDRYNISKNSSANTSTDSTNNSQMNLLGCGSSYYSSDTTNKQKSKSFINLYPEYGQNQSEPYHNDYQQDHLSNYSKTTDRRRHSDVRYHSNELDKFLEEYRKLHNQLDKMKETFEGINEMRKLETLEESALDVYDDRVTSRDNLLPDSISGSMTGSMTESMPEMETNLLKIQLKGEPLPDIASPLKMGLESDFSMVTLGDAKEDGDVFDSIVSNGYFGRSGS